MSYCERQAMRMGAAKYVYRKFTITGVKVNRPYGGREWIVSNPLGTTLTRTGSKKDAMRVVDFFYSEGGEEDMLRLSEA